jgi:hypothetical protein
MNTSPESRALSVPPGSPSGFWPCPNNCMSWCRDDVRFVDGKPQPGTNHHPRCEYVDASLIDVWRVSYDGGSYVSDRAPMTTHQRETITREKMHREIYENLPEFQGF